MEYYIYIHTHTYIELTKVWSEPLKIPAPPEAKFTPVTAADSLFFFLSKPLNERYGGGNGKPNFSADQPKKKKKYYPPNRISNLFYY